MLAVLAPNLKPVHPASNIASTADTPVYRFEAGFPAIRISSPSNIAPVAQGVAIAGPVLR